MDLERREFLKKTAWLGGAAAAAPLMHTLFAAQPRRPDETRQGEMIYRTLGKTGEKVSLVGLGGFHIGKLPSEQEAVKLMRTAIDRGITFMDNCWDYHGGKSERWMGKALQDGYRDKVFLMTKIDGRTRKSAAAQIEDSLRRLDTDRIDLMQMHEIIRPDDPDVTFEEEGAWKALVDAQKAGKIRYLGFTGHKDPFVHLRMLEMAKANDADLAAVQMPLNVMDAHFRSFEKQVLPVLVERNIGVLGMKPLGSTLILQSGTVTPIECLHYAMNLPTSVVITGIENNQNLEQAFEAARTFKPMSERQVAQLLAKTAPVAQKGKYELYKTTFRFDGTAKNPQWLGGPMG